MGETRGREKKGRVYVRTERRKKRERKREWGLFLL